MITGIIGDQPGKYVLLLVNTGSPVLLYYMTQCHDNKVLMYADSPAWVCYRPHGDHAVKNSTFIAGHHDLSSVHVT